MQFVNNIVAWFRNLSIETLIDIMVAIIVIIVFGILSSGFSYILLKIFNRKKSKEYIKSTSLYLPLNAMFVLVGVFLAVNILALPTAWMKYIYKGFKIAIILIIAKGIADAFSSNSKIFKRLQHKGKLKENKALTNFFSKIIKVIIYIIAGFMVVSEFGYNLNGIIAGLGLGSVVIALAAQDIAKNLFGGAAIIFDKPFEVGDYIETGTISGTVEDITFRSTRIRKVDNTVVTVTNSVLSNESISNWNRITKRRYEFNIRIPLNTKPEIIDRIVSRMKFMLKSNKNIIEDSVEVFFNQFNEDSINILTYLYTNITNYDEYMQLKNDINLDVKKLLETENIKLSYPTQNVYVSMESFDKK